jgi:hypothetical protein
VDRWTELEQSAIWEAKVVEWFKDFFIIASILCGSFAALWLQDDLDHLEIIFVAYLGIPVATLYYGARALVKDFHTRYVKTALLAPCLLFFCFAYSNLQLLNALSAEPISIKRDVEHKSQESSKNKVLTIAAKRGGLGMIYRTRF